MTPEEWEGLYKLTGDALRRAILEGIWQASPGATGDESNTYYTRAAWDGRRKASWTDGEFIPGANLDIVKIVMETKYEPGMDMSRLGGSLRLYAEMWRGTQYVRADLLIEKQKEFIERLKEDGFTEQKVNETYLHYLWRKRS